MVRRYKLDGVPLRDIYEVYKVTIILYPICNMVGIVTVLF